MSVPRLIAETGRAEIATTEVDIRVYRSCMIVYSRLTISFESLKKLLAVVHFFLPDSNA